MLHRAVFAVFAVLVGVTLGLKIPELEGEMTELMELETATGRELNGLGDPEPEWRRKKYRKKKSRCNEAKVCCTSPPRFTVKYVWDCCKDWNCADCHYNGCDQCKPGTFKANFYTPCVKCSDYDPCASFCDSHNGSKQCTEGKLVDITLDRTIFKGKCGNNDYTPKLKMCDCPRNKWRWDW